MVVSLAANGLGLNDSGGFRSDKLSINTKI
jgi:hypothetical protein